MDLSFFKNFSECAIVFSAQYKNIIQHIYDELSELFPEKDIYLLSSDTILCSTKFKQFQSYLIVGVQCPLHPFDNALQYKVKLKEEYRDSILTSDVSIVDSIYDISQFEILSSKIIQLGDKNFNKDIENMNVNTQITVVSDYQEVYSYFSSQFENVTCANEKLYPVSRVQTMMKESTVGAKIKSKKLIGVIFTNKCFEHLAESITTRLNEFTRAYKIYLKDVSYERLISIDNLDCIVLVDCPLFECNLKLHIPVLTPFSVDCALSGEFVNSYDKNKIIDTTSKELVVRTYASDLMVKREYQGVLYRVDEEDMTIHQGKSGIAAEYENEKN